MKRLCVFGSVNLDYVVRLARFPKPGETVEASSSALYPGGKGANGAVAAARLGAEVVLVGCVGDDPEGTTYLTLLEREGIRTHGIERRFGVETGRALIELEESGENRIVLVPGANAFVDAALFDRNWSSIADCATALLQLEIPLPAVLHACVRLHEAGITVILDPAPAKVLPPEAFASIDVLTPNEHELTVLAGHPVGSNDDLERAVSLLRALGSRSIVVKAGERGAYFDDGSGLRRAPAYRVSPVDTTAAGDTFDAALAVALAEGATLADAVGFANAAGALATTAVGAQTAMPSRADVEHLIATGERA